MLIRRSAITQYFLIYLMLIMSNSCMSAFYLNQSILRYTVLGFFVLLGIQYRRYWEQYSFIGVIILLIGVVFQRFLNGGVGISAFFELAIPILCAHMAVLSDKDNFLRRFINVICFFATVSVIFWFLFLISPELVDLWPAVKYFTQAIGSRGYEVYWHGKGVLLYSFLEIHPTRNCGIYSEPGVYQIVLNSALFILLFWKNKLAFEKSKDYYKRLIIIFVTLITCQSTTGYISMVILFAAYIMQRNGNAEIRTKRKIVFLVMLGIIGLVVEFMINLTDSILYNQVIFKLFGGSDGVSFDVTQGSGQYRLGTIIFCLGSIVNNPLGIGYDAFRMGKDSAMVAASLLSFACVYGIFVWFAIIVWFLAPVVKKEKSMVIVAFILMFVNTTLGQTLLLYPTQLAIPIYLAAHSWIELNEMERGADCYE